MSYGINCSLCDLLCDSDGMFSVQSGRRFGRVFYCKLGCLENGLRSLKKFVEEVSSGTLHERCKIDILNDILFSLDLRAKTERVNHYRYRL